MFGIDLFDPETVWLNMTNIALGLVTLLCVFALLWGVVAELRARYAERHVPAALPDSHTFAFPHLGVTMADGGSTIEEEPIDDVSDE